MSILCLKSYSNLYKGKIKWFLLKVCKLSFAVSFCILYVHNVLNVIAFVVSSKKFDYKYVITFNTILRNKHFCLVKYFTYVNYTC